MQSCHFSLGCIMASCGGEGGRAINGTSLFTRQDIALHSKEDDAWIIHAGYVYDITSFLERHPGGKDILLENLGKDVTRLMKLKSPHKHSKIAYGWLKKYLIGKVQLEDNETEYDETDINNLAMDGYREDLVDWSKPMLAQVGQLGHHYKKWVHSPVDRKLRLFESSFVEFFSKTPWFIVPILWIPVVLFAASVAIHELSQQFFGSRDGRNVLFHSPLVYILFCVLFSMGVAVWSLVEYCLHRFLFHINPPDDSPFWITFHFFLHGQHHKVPFDGDRLVFPPVAAAVFASMFYGFFVTVIPFGMGCALFSGGLMGYVMYDCMHYYLHHGSPKVGGYFHDLKKYHVSHHFEQQNKGFGISSKVWDYPFKTAPQDKIS